MNSENLMSILISYQEDKIQILKEDHELLQSLFKTTKEERDIINNIRHGLEDRCWSQQQRINKLEERIKILELMAYQNKYMIDYERKYGPAYPNRKFIAPTRIEANIQRLLENEDPDTTETEIESEEERPRIRRRLHYHS